ncbi:HupE/UreJ family protein [Subsaxibacter sp. CAU 1640]|uniref:HupE/UreJ family protein n=1 Tax=Subsaxibacter sp. CAU 1640 TaxID=2933271 RepID=UPI0020068754|nr:HupE/UreJ family protein [Subsaxibacter sp. CAU 1640]MCK7589264.1 HupE/UreJ family protein [Subsaxibacter sp. CAU 1640]
MLDNFWFNVRYGIDHILNVYAYHHLLFLIVLSVPFLFKDWKRLLLLVSLFTLGHTLSLLMAVYGIIKVNLKLIDFLIPLIILVVALYNVFTAGKKATSEKIGILFLSSLFFGLVHGLGFVGLFSKHINQTIGKLVALLELALGIELGQLIAAFIVVFLGFLCQTIFRFSKRDWVVVLSAVVVGVLIPMLINNGLFA